MASSKIDIKTPVQSSGVAFDRLVSQLPKPVQFLILAAAFLLFSQISPGLKSVFEPSYDVTAAAAASPLAQVLPVPLFRLAVPVLTMSALFAFSFKSPAKFAIAYIVPAILMYSAYLRSFHDVIVIVFMVVPALELLAGPDEVNPTVEEEAELTAHMGFRLMTWLWVPMQLGLLVWGGHVVGTWGLSLWELVLFTLSFGVQDGALSINIAHELIHKAPWYERQLGRVLLACVCYGHFDVEHVWGHHKHVSTPHDPASSRLGESLYSFIPRTIVGSFRSGWHIAAERCTKRGQTVWSLHNEVLNLLVLSAALAGGLTALFGARALAFFVGRSAVAFLLLEVINYIEHYGLEREESATGPGGFEPVRPVHSWNSDARITHLFLFKLQRHSDHHANAGRRYQILRTFPEPTAAQLPTGYAGMVLLALVPPLFFALMNPRVHKARGFARVDVHGSAQ